MDIKVDIDPTEMDYVTRQLSILGEFDRRELPEIMADTAADLLEGVEKYAPELPNQRYIRTGRYGASVYSETKAIPNGMVAIAGTRGVSNNGERYDPYLKDERNQAGIHKGRWTTMADDAENAFPDFVKRVERVIERYRL